MTADARPGPTPAPYTPALLPLALLALGTLVWLTLRSEISEDGDIGWHIASGRWIAAHGQVPATDPFSYTFLGKPWMAHEWLADLLLAGASAVGDWRGIALVVGLAVASLLLIIGLEVGRWLTWPRTIIALMLILLVLRPFILARPHVLAWVPLALWTIMLMRAREADRPPPLTALPLMLVWANLHGSFIMGLLLTGAFALEALLAAGDRALVFRQWLVFGLAAAATSLITPAGLDGLLFPFKVNGMAINAIIVEWQPTVVAKLPGFAIFLLFSLFVLLSRGVQMPLVRLLILCGLLYMAFDSVRHQSVLAIVGTLVVAAPLGRTFAIEPQPGPVSRRLLAGLAAAAALFAGIMLANPVPRPQSPSHPAAMIAALPPALRSQPVLNSYDFGGSLILAGIPPFIDGRADIYGDAFALNHVAIVFGDAEAFNKAVARWGITWTILSPKQPLVAVLDASPDWQRLAADNTAVVHVRRQRPAAPPATPATPAAHPSPPPV